LVVLNPLQNEQAESTHTWTRLSTREPTTLPWHDQPPRST